MHVDVPLQVELCGETLSTGVTVVNCLKREIMLSFSDFEQSIIFYTIKHIGIGDNTYEEMDYVPYETKEAIQNIDAILEVKRY